MSRGPSLGVPRVWHRRTLGLALPIIATNLTVPLLGAVDTAVVGHLPDPVPLAAVAIGAVLFSFLYWGFGFLRMSTTAFAAQAIGARDGAEAAAVFHRAALTGLAIAAALMLAQGPIGWAAFLLFDTDPAVESAARTYFDIRVWGAPAVLVNYAILGWFLGLQDARTPLLIQVWINGVNAVLDLAFVMGLGMAADGVALATAIAEWSGLALGLALVARRLGRFGARPSRRQVLDMARIRRMVSVNRDIFIRTLLLIGSMVAFIVVGGRLGAETLAVNAVLMNFVAMASHGLDAFAHAAEALVGRAIGTGRPRAVAHAVRAAFVWAVGLASLVVGVFFLAGPSLVALLTGIEAVRAGAAAHLAWPAAMPLVAVFAYTFDGIFLGATRADLLRNGMILSALVYAGALAILVPAFGNHGLWASLMAFNAARGVFLALAYPTLRRDAAFSG